MGSKSCYWPGRNWRHKPPPPQTSKVSGPQIWCLGICLAIFWWTMFRHLQCIIYFFVQRHLAASRPSRGRRNMQRWPKQIQTLPQTWLYQPLDQNSKIPLKWNMKSSQNKSSSALPQIWLWKRSTLKLSVSFQALCDKVKWTKAVAVKSPCTWEGWAVVSAQFGDQEVTQFGLYFFCIHAQGVVAAVSVFVNSNQTEQILRRFAVYHLVTKFVTNASGAIWWPNWNQWSV